MRQVFGGYEKGIMLLQRFAVSVVVAMFHEFDMVGLSVCGPLIVIK